MANTTIFKAFILAGDKEERIFGLVFKTGEGYKVCKAPCWMPNYAETYETYEELKKEIGDIAAVRFVEFDESFREDMVKLGEIFEKDVLPKLHK